MTKKTKSVKPIELRNYVSAATVTRVLCLSPSTVRNAIKRGTVTGFKMGREWFVEKSQAERQWHGGKIVKSRSRGK